MSRRAPNKRGDDVQRSLELLDRVLSEFDDLENGNPPVGGGNGNGNGGGNGGNGGGGDDSPSLHSEDDGYMSMNGRRAKFVLNLRPQVQMGPGGGGLPLPPEPPPPDPPPPNLLRRLTNAPTTASADSLQFPPPPEEAERIISTLLPRVSPGNSSKRSTNGFRRPYNGSLKLGNGYNVEDHHVTTATQTTLPKTRHQRPYGWENGPTIPANYHPNHQPVNPAVRFGSLPYDGSLQWLNPLPPRTLPTAMDRHREVRRRVGGGGDEPAEGGGEAITQQLRIVTESCDDDAANFSDDSLEELLPPPPPPPPPPLTKRGSIAWEVPLDGDDEALLTPGSTKVIGRRRRRSTDRSSTGSMTRLKDQDEWPDPPTGTEDGSLSPFSDSSHLESAPRQDDDSSLVTLPPELNAADLTAGGTYVIRKGRRKERKPLQPGAAAAAVSRASSKSSINSTSHKHRLSPPKFGEMKRCSSTFDNIKSLLKDGLIEGLDDDPPDFAPPTPPPALLKVVSLPSLLVDDNTPTPSTQTNTHRRDRTINRTVKHKSQGKTVVDSISSNKVSIDVGVQVTDDFSNSEPSKNEQTQSENSTAVTKAEISTQIQPEELCELIDEKVSSDVAVEVVDLSLVETDTTQPESKQSKIPDESIVISEVNKDESVVISEPEKSVADHVEAESLVQSELIVRPVRKSISLEENCVFRKALPLEPESFYEKDLPLEPDSIEYDKALPKEPVEVYDKDLPSEPDMYDEKSLPPVPPPSSRESDVDSLSGRELEENEKNSTGTMIMHVEIGKEKSVFNPWDKSKETPVIPVLEEDRKLKIEDDCEDENEKRDELKSEKPPADFNVKVEVLQHEFGPLPPSPVEEDEDEYADILRPSPVKTDEPFYRCVEPPASDPIGSRFLNRPPEPPPHRDATSSLKTRSMDAGFTRNHNNQHSASRKEIPSERRTLPSELPGPSRRRTFQKRTNTCGSGSGHSPRDEGGQGGRMHMQVSCSLPETPIFARGCDIPRTPLRRTPEVTPGSARTAPRPGGLQTTGSYRLTAGAAGHGTVGSGVSLGQAMVGAELLRLNGGPGRGWYPRHRQQPRPASVEHLDHLARSGLSPGLLSSPPASAWDASRKPLTLPPNLTPKFFQRSPREALRRVTSLLIRKGNSSKDQKKEVLSPTQGGEPGDGRQKRGFFKSFWKKSRQYSLEQQ
ncbi:uncharacterized protein LOC111059742 isoform X2 [Nilaparvata lugens]|uniref:uncharacterized protein LOC111059742 isoform X1 n=1 Tax=Nilaparvata lugens TaxID=108931 RepID=UPI00193E88DA|nr:uncharacterized protein LOC111059742 isoform X1 [Nilaparvata lugens]XP_039279586.1 uncharacterized protein LOC111059742 isoform X2 [Nilaparvata lugens]